MTIRAVVICLDLKIFPLSLKSLPARKNVSARKAGCAVQHLGVRRSVGSCRDTLADSFIVDVPLHSKLVAGILGNIHAKSALDRPPAIVFDTSRMKLRPTVEGHAIDSVVDSVAVAAAIPCIDH